MKRLTPPLAPVLVAFASVVLGLGTVIYVTMVSDSVIRVAVLPLVMVLLALLVIDKRSLFLLIMLFRSACDPVFNAAKFSASGVSLGMGAALNALVILIAVLFMLERRAADARRNIPPWVLLVLPVLMLSVLRSPEPGTALRTALVLLSYAAMFLMPFHLVKTKDDVSTWIRVVLLSSLLPILYAFVDIAINWNAGGPDGFRLRSTFSHPNIFAFYLLLMISLQLYRIKTQIGPLSVAGRWWSGISMVMLIVLLLLTKTRSAWLACFAIFGIYAAAFERRMLLYLIAAPLLALLLPEVRERLLDLTASSVYDPYAPLNSFDWRLEIWKSGLAWMQPLSWLIGNGLNAFTYYSPQFFPLAGNANPGAHNVYVQWFFETGALGMLCFIWIIFRLLRRLAQRLPLDRHGSTILVALVIAYLVVCASDNMIDYLSFNWYFWFVIGTACRSVEVMQTSDRAAASNILPLSAAKLPTTRGRKRLLRTREPSTPVTPSTVSK